MLVLSMMVALFVSLYYAFQNMWHPVTTDLQEVSSSITIIILPLLMGSVQHNLSALSERHCIGDVRHYCNGKVSTLRHVTKLCISYFSFFYLSSPSSHDTHVHSCFTTHLGKHLWIQVCFSPSAASNSVTAHCFEWTSVSAIWGSHVILPSVEWNSCDY